MIKARPMEAIGDVLGTGKPIPGGAGAEKPCRTDPLLAMFRHHPGALAQYLDCA